jgi:hypothetical protein
MNLKNVIFGIAILVLTLFVVIYGINTFYEKPEWNDYCGDSKTARFVNNSVDCLSEGGEWTAVEKVPQPVGAVAIGYCDLYTSCQEDFEEAQKDYSRNIFLIALPLGIILIAVGALLFALDAVGVGLMAGGVGTLLYGTGSYWRFAENWMKFGLSLIGLVVVIWLAYYFNKKFSKK